ncbi:glycine oxidase ThiO [Nodosilinea sp. PGN35]|uniref:glycine oxidase ThiO n=1 Tax=Nodosilinea sp. PGN35 TaxID=3020489 RepID=UPI002413EF06|nr:glycine oxidase ThiO [Nodosilinea sp. TSF1-S3]
MVNQESDALVVGGGVIGLAIALELRQQGAAVTVLSRDLHQAASHAAAGMLAPRAEGLSPGPMLDLCLDSLALYPSWVNKLEALTGQTVGYWPCGILAPSRTAPAPAPEGWLNATTLAHYQPGLGRDVQGAFWYPEEGQVDNRLLVQALRAAAIDLGVTLHEGTGAIALRQYQNRVERVCTAQAGDFSADQVVLATGAWAHELLPLPVFPQKGEMASLRVPLGHGTPQPLRRVLYGEDIYIVPRRDGRIVLGATRQQVGFAPHNTAGGVHRLLTNAIALLPQLADFTLDETWWGYRPATPDEWPILGPGPAANLTLATGHYRNGILLTPITAQLVAQAVLGRVDARLAAFSWQRFHRSAPGAISRPPSGSPTPKAMTFTDTAPNRLVADSTPTVAQADTPLTIAGRTFASRLMTGTGKYDDFEVMRQSIAASGCEIVTVAVRRVQTSAPGHQGLAEALDWSKIWMLPNTAGCKTAEEAIRVARLGREMAKLLGQEDNNFVKLEVIPDAKYLLPDPIGTLEAAEQLVKEGFAVLPYINADPLLAKRLEEAGCATVMPLGSPIGSGQGIRNAANIQIIVETAQVPVVVDAGIGTPSEAAQAMEMGADALLINTAIAKAADPIAMGRAMGMATAAGRLAYRAGRIPVQGVASASSPLTGRVTE